MCKIIDQTIIEIIAILIAGAGLFAVMIKFYVPALNTPEINTSFFGKNPYATKRDIIEKLNTKIFTGYAFIGLLIKVVSIIFSNKVEVRLYKF